MTSANILVVEDDLDIAQLVALHLREIGQRVDVVHDGLTGLERALETPYDLIVLDLMLPGLSGTELCQRLRLKSNHSLILMLTARSSELDRVLGLELGADDYLTKPFSFRELQARVKALLRRGARSALPAPTATDTIEVGGLLIEVNSRQVTLDGRAVNLTAKEFDLLCQFAQHPGRVYTRAELLDLVWGYGYDGLEHTVNSHINRLRSKIERDPADPEFIQTVWGVGYRFATPPSRRTGTP